MLDNKGTWGETVKQKKVKVHNLAIENCVVFSLMVLNLALQATLIVWGEEDRVFPLELAHRLKR